MGKFYVTNFLVQLAMHGFGALGLYLAATQSSKLATIVFCLAQVAIIVPGGTNAGMHRYFCHRSYTATKPLRYLLYALTTLCFQYSILWWVAIHRMHHKHTDTNKDPHNIKQGFWYAHVGWLFNITTKYSELTEIRKEVDMSDLEQDPVLVFQDKHFHWIIIGIIAFTTWIPCYFWNESLLASFCIAAMLRAALTFNAAYFVNSIGHTWGYKPYEESFEGRNNGLVSYLSGGEGTHNFHHVFPTDYRQNELAFNPFNPAARFIEFWAWLGLAYNLKTASVDVVEKRAWRTGDGTVYPSKKSNQKIAPEDEYIYDLQLIDRGYKQTG